MRSRDLFSRRLTRLPALLHSLLRSRSSRSHAAPQRRSQVPHPPGVHSALRRPRLPCACCLSRHRRRATSRESLTRALRRQHCLTGVPLVAARRVRSIEHKSADICARPSSPLTARASRYPLHRAAAGGAAEKHDNLSKRTADQCKCNGTGKRCGHHSQLMHACMSAGL